MEDLIMAQTDLRQRDWAQGWGVVRRIHQRLEFVAFFETREDAEDGAVEAGTDCEVCWLSYRAGSRFPSGNDSDGSDG
jgi:hypothetical protein